MKYLLAVVLLCATFAPYILPWPPVHIEPHMAPERSLVPTVTPTPEHTP